MQVLKMLTDVGELSPPALVLSAYQGCVTRGWDPQISLLRGSTLITYSIMSRGSPWVTPSLLCKKWPEPSPVSCATSVAQWQYQLNLNCAPLATTDSAYLVIFSSSHPPSAS